MKKRCRVDYGAFGCGGSENDSSNESGSDNDVISNSSEAPRRSVPTHRNDNVEDERKASLSTIIDMLVNVSRRQALQILCCDEKDDAKEVKRRHRLLARKCHPDEWHNVCDFDRVTGAHSP